MGFEINEKNLFKFAYTNESLIKGEPKGICVTFCGLDMTLFLESPYPIDEELAENGIINITPLTNPWSWMNDKCIEQVDNIISIVENKYFKDKPYNLVVRGGSMGGYESLMYTVHGKFNPVACIVDCPCTNLEYLTQNKPVFTRQVFDAFYDYPDVIKAIHDRSPINAIDKMPKNIKYHIFHCRQDPILEIGPHSDEFCKRAEGILDFTYDISETGGHTQLSEELTEKFKQYIIYHVING